MKHQALHGAPMDPGLVVHHAKLRLFEARPLVRGGDRRRDALHPGNYAAGAVEVHQLEFFEDSHDEDGEVHAWLARLGANDPRVALDGALDLARWMETLNQEEKELLALRYGGFTLGEIADIEDESVSTVFARLRELGAELAEFAELKVTKKPRKARGSMLAAA